MRGNILRVFNYLKENDDGLTSKEAFEKFGTMSLNRIVFRLRSAGENIESVPERGLNRHKEPVHFVRYFLHKS